MNQALVVQMLEEVTAHLVHDHPSRDLGFLVNDHEVDRTLDLREDQDLDPNELNPEYLSSHRRIPEMELLNSRNHLSQYQIQRHSKASSRNHLLLPII